MVIVWEKPACPNCNTIKGILQEEGIQFETRQIFDGDNITPEARALMDKHGIKAAPIVKSDHVVFGGFDKAKLDELIDWEQVWADE